MGYEDHFDDSRRLLDYGYEFLSLKGRFLAPLVEEEGGAGTPDLPPLDPTERKGALMAPSLPDGQWSVGDFRDSGLGRSIEAWFRSTMPVVVGGTS